MRCSEMQGFNEIVAGLVVAISLFTSSFLVASGQTITPFVPSARMQSSATEVTLESSTGRLFGTLLLPAGKPPFPIVLIIAGSGQTDRDGNSEGLSGKSDCLRLLAEGLARGGIGSLRYDKRGVGKSVAARLATNSFETQVDDAAQWVAWLRKDSRVNSVGIVGHSEGAFVGTLAAERGVVRALVSLAGAGRRFDELFVEQMESAVKAGKLSKSVLPPFRTALAELRAGRTISTRPREFPDWMWKGLFQPRAQEYLISLFRYDPAAELAKLPKLNVRILVVQGTTDLMGSLEHANLLAVAAGSKPVVIEGMNHELKSAPLDPKANDAASEDPKRPLAEGLLENIVPFLIRSLGSGESHSAHFATYNPGSTLRKFSNLGKSL